MQSMSLLPFTLLPLTLWSVAINADVLNVPPLQLAAAYQHQDATHYWVSEKLDGVRAYWDGHALWSRAGHRYTAPEWFIASLPDTPLDGELWQGRGQFEALSAAVRRYQPQDEEWQHIRFMAFDLPTSSEPFELRYQTLQQLITTHPSPYLQLVTQTRVTDNAELATRLAEVDAAGGEGLMLRLQKSFYQAGRGQQLLKLKQFADAEARVLAHLPGLGKYRGMLGALLVETPEGRRFKLGTGFSDLQREQPPPIGATVTYRYQGETSQQLPRFASFLRVRSEQPINK